MLEGIILYYRIKFIINLIQLQTLWAKIEACLQAMPADARVTQMLWK